MERKVKALLQEWNVVQEQLAAIKEKEMELRKKIKEIVFPTYQQGVNSVDIAQGYVLKMTPSYTMKVDNDVLSSIKSQLIDEGVPVDEIFRYKAEVNTASYKKLNDASKLKLSQVITISEGACKLEIVKPKK